MIPLWTTLQVTCESDTRLPATPRDLLPLGWQGLPSAGQLLVIAKTRKVDRVVAWLSSIPGVLSIDRRDPGE
mgnify:CR=1 FL=1